jgi:predicted DNA binding CopG/RHH family protein
MNYTRVYNEISATYGEVALALKKLGFQDVSTSEHFRFMNEKHNSEVKLPARLLDAPFAKANLAGYSYQLYMQGVIKHIDNFAKLIEKNRFFANAKEQKKQAA